MISLPDTEVGAPSDNPTPHAAGLVADAAAFIHQFIVFSAMYELMLAMLFLLCFGFNLFVGSSVVEDFV